MNKFKSTNLHVPVIVFLNTALILNCFMLSYIGGQINSPYPLIFVIMIYSQVGLLFLLAAIVLVIIYCFGKNKNVLKAFFVLMAILIGMAAGYLVPGFIEPPIATHLRGFDKWVLRNVNSEAIQEWIIDANESFWFSEVSENFDNCYIAREGFPEELPDFLVGFKPCRICFEKSNLDGSKMVEYSWGGGMFHWNLIIGEPNMAMPEKEIEKIQEGLWQYRKIVKPGVYVYTNG